MVRERRAFGSIRKLTSGRYQGIYTGPDLLRHTAPTTFTAKIDVEGRLHEERKLIEANEWSPPKYRAEKARDAAGPRLRDLRHEVDRQATYGQGRAVEGKYESGVRHDAPDSPLPVSGKMRLRDITKGAVRKWYDETQDGSADSPRATSKAYGLLRAIVNTAVDDDLIEASPVHIRGAGYRPKRRRLEPATIEELDVIVENMPDREKLMIQLASWARSVTARSPSSAARTSS
jgi:hypothetical protein